MLKVRAVFTAFAVASEGGAGNDAKFAGSFAILSGATCRRGGDIATVVIRDVHGVAPTATAWRERSLAFNSSQHDQVDAASIPALVRQVTEET